jgi:hypothetical protein
VKLTITAFALALAAMTAPSFAASHAASAPMADTKPSAQQSKMATCNKDAGERRATNAKRS